MRCLLLVAALLALTGCPQSGSSSGSSAPVDSGIAAPGTHSITTPSGLRYSEIVPGTGPSPQNGQTVVVHYLGRFPDGNTFDGSRDRGPPFKFRIGTGAVIKGWDEGVLTMKVGGVRRLVVPPDLAYGEQGQGKIGPNATLVFDVELLGIE